MIKIDNIEVFGWESAIRGMRNPLNSWDKSDSEYKYMCNCLGPDESPHYCENCYYDACNPTIGEPVFVVGPNDLKLMQSLIKAGTDHSKFMRMINVTMDITAPLYWWKEFDTYKVGTVANSCSTMHKIHDKEFTLDDFSHEHLGVAELSILCYITDSLNFNRNRYNVEKSSKDYWWQMIQLLPSSYNQKRTVQLNYQVLRNMYFSRKNHKLDEWVNFCNMIERLPYSKELVCI